jgi:hypothetical protein
MKARTLTIVLVAALAACDQASAVTSQHARSHSTTLVQRRHSVQSHRPAGEARPQATGVIPRAIRSGNPLQMLNPLAPAKYGTAEENVMLNPDVPGKWDGIKLLGISF